MPYDSRGPPGRQRRPGGSELRSAGVVQPADTPTSRVVALRAPVGSIPAYIRRGARDGRVVCTCCRWMLASSSRSGCTTLRTSTLRCGWSCCDTSSTWVRPPTISSCIATRCPGWPARSRFGVGHSSPWRRSGNDPGWPSRRWGDSSGRPVSRIPSRAPECSRKDSRRSQRTRAAVADVFGEEAQYQLLRVMGFAMARVADAVVSAFLVNVEPAARREDPSDWAARGRTSRRHRCCP